MSTGANAQTEYEFFHWPNHVIGKRESQTIREAHNAAVNALYSLREECGAIRKKIETLQAQDEGADDEDLCASSIGNDDAWELLADIKSDLEGMAEGVSS